jgi:hypothetical protein
MGSNNAVVDDTNNIGTPTFSTVVDDFIIRNLDKLFNKSSSTTTERKNDSLYLIIHHFLNTIVSLYYSLSFCNYFDVNFFFLNISF